MKNVAELKRNAPLRRRRALCRILRERARDCERPAEAPQCAFRSAKGKQTRRWRKLWAPIKKKKDHYFKRSFFVSERGSCFTLVLYVSLFSVHQYSGSLNIHQKVDLTEYLCQNLSILTHHQSVARIDHKFRSRHSRIAFQLKC